MPVIESSRTRVFCRAALLLVVAFAFTGCSTVDDDAPESTASGSMFGLSGDMALNVVPGVCPELPNEPVDATYGYPGSNSFFDTTLMNVPEGFDISDGLYLGWCVEDNFRANTSDPAMPYCSLDSNLPGNLNDYPWDKVNYLLNHKNGTPDEVEAAIWVLVWGSSNSLPVTPAVTAMVADANANGVGYLPGDGDVVAVILYTGDGGIGPDGFQDTIIEVPVPGLPQLASLGDLVWCDENGDGIFGEGESGLDGVTVNLRCAGDDGSLDTSDDILATTETSFGGTYLFSDLPAGLCRVSIDTATLPEGCDEPSECPSSHEVTLVGGEAYLDADFCVRPPAPTGDEGCTPGYWKNHLGAWETTAYGPEMMVGSVFTESVKYPDLYATSLKKALKFRGGRGEMGAARNLLRAAVASVLNASSSNVEFVRSVGDIVGDVDEALASGSRSRMLRLARSLDNDNNLGCPLGRDGVRNTQD